MTERERILTEYTADTRNFRRGAQVYDRTLARQERLTNDRLTRIDRRWERSTRNVLATRTALSGLSVFIGGAGLNQVRAYAEGWRDVQRRLQSVGATTEQNQKQFVGLALRTRGAISGTAAAVQRMAKSTGDDIDITTRRVETLQKLLAAGGASGTERSSVSLQLGQALQSGVLSGDEYRSIRETAPVEFLDALAKAAGVTRKELKSVAEAQKLTTEVVLEALDSLAQSADEKFGAMAISGEEAFNVLATGLTVYAGNVDEAVGATQTINEAMVWLGEYLTEAGDGAETFAQSLKIVGTIALATAGSRGIGAVNAAMQRSAQVARVATAEAQKEVQASRQKVTVARQELASTRALIAEREADVRARLNSNRKLKTSLNRLEAAKRKNAQASSALAGAEARAAVATDRLSAAQGRLTVSARASAAALRTAQSVLGFFGGPVGLAITAFTTLPLLMKDTEDRVRDLNDASDAGSTAMDRYADASKKAAEEQERLGGEINATTQAMLSQSRADLQRALRELQEAQRDLLDDVRGVGLFDSSEITGPLSRLQNEFERQLGQFGASNPFVEQTIQGLQELQAGATDLQALSRALNDVQSVGREAQTVLDRFNAEIIDGADIDQAREDLLSYARAAGDFRDQLAAIDAADGAFQTNIAFERLKMAIFDASKASDIFERTAVGALAEMVRQAARGELEALAMQAALEGNNEEAERLRALLEAATGQAEALANTDMTTPITSAANEAARLADNLAAARAERLDKLTGSNPDFFDPRGESPNSGRVTRTRPVPSQNRPGARSGSSAGGGQRRSGGGGSSAIRDQRDAERDLLAVRDLLVNNGHRALFAEQSLNSERERLRDLLPTLISLGLSRAEAETVIQRELERTRQELNDVESASMQQAESMARAMLSQIRQADSLGDAIARIGDRLLELALDPVFDQLASQFARIGSGGGGGGIIGQFIGAILPNAKGNAFGRHGVTMHAKGDVFNRPTMFQYGAGRLGIMAEAGEEGVLPLMRDSRGRLGVIAQVPTTPTAPTGSMRTDSSFIWSGDMNIYSNSDDPQQVGREATDQMNAMFQQMFNKQLGDAMRGGGVLDQRYSKKGGM
jgi:tape measure domain-containing protein